MIVRRCTLTTIVAGFLVVITAYVLLYKSLRHPVTEHARLLDADGNSKLLSSKQDTLPLLRRSNNPDATPMTPRDVLEAESRDTRPITASTRNTVCEIAQSSVKRSENQKQEKNLTICILGNAETLISACRVHDMWSQQFPSCWYIWNDPQPTSKHDPSIPKQLYISGRSSKTNALAFVDGIDLCLKYMRDQQSVLCDYFFTHDDDLVFGLDPNWKTKLKNSLIPFHELAFNETGLQTPPQPSIAATLVSVLSTYRPAVASFPWEVGLSKYNSMQSIHSSFAEKAVAPLTGFDNGMVLYHRNIVDLFIPFSPRGEGGFIGKWTLGAHFLQLFVPSVFGQHAVSITALQYNNTVNLDLIDQKKRHSSRRIEGNLVHIKGVRHPYEYLLNEKYIAFLRKGLKRPWARIGRDLEVFDVSPPIQSQTFDIYSPTWILSRLNNVYDIRSDVLENNLYLRQLPPQLIHQTIVETPIHIALHMFVYQRLNSFKQLWQDFHSAYVPSKENGLPNVTISTHIHYDNTQLEHLPFLLSLNSHLGPVHVTPRMQHAGLRINILESAASSHADTFHLMLEDDLRLSRWALVFAVVAIRKYFYDPATVPSPSLIGISLYAQIFSEAAEDFLDLSPLRSWKSTRPDTFLKTYLWQQPQSWGAIYHGLSWTRFLTWYRHVHIRDSTQYLIPCSYTNRWPASTSWKKALFRYMVENDLYMVYPVLPDRLSFSVNALGIGANDRSKPGGKDRKRLEERLLLRLFDDHAVSKYFNVDPSKTLPVIETIRENLLDFNSLARVGAIARKVVGVMGIPSVDTKLQISSFKNVSEPRTSAKQVEQRHVPTVSEINKLSSRIQSQNFIDGHSAKDFRDKNDVRMVEAGRTMHHRNAFDLSQLCKKSSASSFDFCIVLIHLHVSGKHRSLALLQQWMDWSSTREIVVVANVSTISWLKAQHSSKFSQVIANQKKTVSAIHYLHYPDGDINVSRAWFLRPIGLQQIFNASTYDCVLLHDDEAALSLNDANYLYATWYGHFFDNLVGPSYLARSHEFDESSKKWNVLRRNTHAVSLILPYAVIVHRQYILDLVIHYGTWIQQHSSCAPMLLNIYIRLHCAQTCPMVVWRWLSAQEKNLLSYRSYETPLFLQIQSACLNDVLRLLYNREIHPAVKSKIIENATINYNNLPENGRASQYSWIVSLIQYSPAAADPRKRYGSSTPFPGQNFLRCSIRTT